MAITKRKIKHTTYFWVWVATLIGFYVIIFLADGDFNSAPDFLLLTFLINIAIGGIMFLLFLVEALPSRDWKHLGLSVVAVFIFFLILFNLGDTDTSTQVQQNNGVVACNVHESCGGGTRNMTAEQCALSVCCQIGDVWVVEDVDSCKLKQQEYATRTQIQQPQYIYVPQQPVPKLEIPEWDPPQNNTMRCRFDSLGDWVCHDSIY